MSRRRTWRTIEANQGCRLSGPALLLFALALLAGCSTFQFPGSSSFRMPEFLTSGSADEKPKTREERKAMIVEQYEAKRNVAQLQVAQNRLNEGDLAGCRSALDQLLIRAPELTRARLLRAEVHLLEGEPELARQQAEAVLAETPTDAEALHTLGLICETAGQSQEALEYYGRAAEAAPDNEAFALSYQALLDPEYSTPGKIPRGSANTAAAAPNKLSETAHDSRAGEALARAYQALLTGDAPTAISQIERATAQEPQNRQLVKQAAVTSLRFNQPAVARAVLEPALARFSRSSDLYRLYGLTLYRQSDFAGAERALTQAVSLDKQDPLAYFLLGQTLARQGRSDAARPHFERAGKLDPSLAALR